MYRLGLVATSTLLYLLTHRPSVFVCPELGSRVHVSPTLLVRPTLYPLSHSQVARLKQPAGTARTAGGSSILPAGHLCTERGGPQGPMLASIMIV